MLAAWRARKIQVATSCALLTEGFDDAELSASVMARPTRSPVFYTQAIGRGPRKADGKVDCVVVDVVGNAQLLDAFKDCSNREWLVERHGHQTPAAVRAAFAADASA